MRGGVDLLPEKGQIILSNINKVLVPVAVASKLRKNSKKKSSYVSTKIEGESFIREAGG